VGFYSYRARRYRGGELESGVLEAKSLDEALSKLREKGLLPISLEEASERSDGVGSILELLGRVKGSDLMLFFKHMAAMLKAGVSLAEALSVAAASSSSGVLSKKIRAMKGDVERGISLSGSMERSGLFPDVVLYTVRAGESSGTLDRSFERIAAFLEAQEALKKKVASAITYPVVVVAFSVVVLAVMSVFVVPRFEAVFAGLGVKVPFVTRLVFDFNRFLRERWFLVVGFLLSAVLALLFFVRSSSLKEVRDSVKFKVPVLGDLLYRTAMIRTFRTLSTLLEAGLSLLEALELAGKVSGSSRVEEAMERIASRVKGGMSLGFSMGEEGIFPLLVVQMVKVGEETGDIGRALENVLGWYELELEEKTKTLASALEPLLIVLVGGMVAIIAFSIFVPIMSAIQSLI